MAYRFKAGESIPDGVARIASAQLDGALATLAVPTRGREEQVHDVRKRIKKIRALLRLVETELAGDFALENARLRAISQVLAPFRDAAAMVRTFDELREEYPGPAAGLTAIRRGLLLQKMRAERQDGLKLALEDAAGELRRVRKRIKRWPLRHDSFSAISAGMEKTLRRGRAAMNTAIESRHPDRFHDWRKRVKDSFYHVRLLRDIWCEVMTGYQSTLGALEERLGRDHDLNLLGDTLRAQPESFGKPPHIGNLCKYIQTVQDNRRAEAEPLGLRIYSEKPAEIVRHWERWWNVWKQNR